VETLASRLQLSPEFARKVTDEIAHGHNRNCDRRASGAEAGGRFNLFRRQLATNLRTSLPPRRRAHPWLAIINPANCDLCKELGISFGIVHHDRSTRPSTRSANRWGQ
jgi:hypothetical protein